MVRDRDRRGNERVGEVEEMDKKKIRDRKRTGDREWYAQWQNEHTEKKQSICSFIFDPLPDSSTKRKNMTEQRNNQMPPYKILTNHRYHP